jgi:hypothetical protein
MDGPSVGMKQARGRTTLDRRRKMSDGVSSCAPTPANQAGYGEASCSADSSAQSFLNVLCQEGQPVCTDPTAPTPREQAAQQSLPENERHLPGFWQMTNGGFLVQCDNPNNHLSENAKKSEESKSQAPAQDLSGDVVAQARTELGRAAHDVKLGSDAIGKAMSDDVDDYNNCANFVGGSLVAAGQITSKDMNANVDNLMDNLRKTGNYTESNSLADVQKGDVVAFNHAHVMICTGFDAKNQPTFIGSNNPDNYSPQKITEGPLTNMLMPATQKAWENNAVIMHRN